MKTKVCEFSSQRSRFLLENFRKSIAAQSVISARVAFKDAAEAPAPRFWVSEARATRIISMMMQGLDPTEGMLLEKREMYREIYRRVKLMKEKNPAMSLGDLVFLVVNDEAPRSYISTSRVKELIYSRKKLLNT